MTLQETIETLTEYQRWREATRQCGEMVRLKSDKKLHKITRIEEYDYLQPYQIDGEEWIGDQDILQPDPFVVGRAIKNAISYLKKIDEHGHQQG